MNSTKSTISPNVNGLCSTWQVQLLGIYLQYKMPGQAMVGGILQADLVVHVQCKRLSTAHHQVELQHVGSPNLHGLGFNVARCFGISSETTAKTKTNNM